MRRWVPRTIAANKEMDMTATLRVDLPVDGLPTAAELPDNFADEARFLLAVKLFEQGRVSSGKAGRLCGMGRVEFLLAASRSGVPVVDLTGDELAQEFA
jgi:Uncharacterised protein family (UPF0175)